MADRVLGIGNALVDLLLKRDEAFLAAHGLPKGGMQLVDEAKSAAVLAGATDYTVAAGGCAANTINGLGQLGVGAAFIGKVGADDFGAAFAADMRGNGVEPKLRTGKSPTGRAVAIITPDSERTFATFLGAAIELGPDDLVPGDFAGYKYFHIEGYLVQNHELVRRAVELAQAAGCTVSIDLASYNVVEANLAFLKEIVGKYVNIVFANEDEAKAFTGRSEEAALADLAAACQIAVVKLGKRGSLAQRGREKARAGILPAKAIDTTGAGDLYASGFLSGLVAGRPLEQCCRLGALTSARVVEVLGAKMPPATWETIRREAKAITGD